MALKSCVWPPLNQVNTICLNTLLALGGSSIEGQTMVFNSFAIVREISHISSLVRRKPKSPLAANHDYVSDLVRRSQALFVDLYFISGGFQGVGNLIVFVQYYVCLYLYQIHLCDWKI